VIVGIVIIVALTVAGVFAPWIAPYGPEERNWGRALQPPSLLNLFGTDETGGDVFSRVIWSIRPDLGLALVVVSAQVAIAIVIGSIAGYFGGKTDELLMRITDVFLAFPNLILAMSVAAFLGRNLYNLALSLVITGWPGNTRLIRGVILSERERLYVEAARAVGASNARVIFRHILPNSIQPILVSATFGLGSTILGFASLSFIGFGAGSGVAEWGYMISLGRDYLFRFPWVATFPGLAIFLTVMGFNLVGDGLRDILDPRLRR
jgi:peptide/nickel transport system permease protein